MLQTITSIDNWVTELIKDDPVRKEIPIGKRINENAQMFALWRTNELGAVTCVSYTEGIPNSVDSMYNCSSSNSDTAVFYTIWSYGKGAGRELIIDASEEIKKQKPQIKNIVTLSPKTEMAEKFHIKNGAWKYRENHDTINYAYELKS